MPAGDRARFERVYREHVAQVLRYALVRVGPDQAKDVVAETFLVAWRRLDAVPPEPIGWLLGVARKVIATQSRGDARRQALGLRLAGQPQDDAFDLSEQSEERQLVLQAFGELSEPDREVLRLVAWDELSREQASASLGITRLAFAVRLHRARHRFADKLDALDRADATTTRREHRAVHAPLSTHHPFHVKEAG